MKTKKNNTSIFVVFIISASGQWKLEQAFFDEKKARNMVNQIKMQSKKIEDLGIVYASYVEVPVGYVG